MLATRRSQHNWEAAVKYGRTGTRPCLYVRVTRHVCSNSCQSNFIFITIFNARNINENMIMLLFQTYGLLTLIGRLGNKIRNKTWFPGSSRWFQVTVGCGDESERGEAPDQGF